MYKLYFHIGSSNHGCEAIVKSTAKILNKELVLYSQDVKTDLTYGVNKYVKVREDKVIKLSKRSIKGMLNALYYKFFKSDLLYYYFTHRDFFEEIKKGDICFSIGGDNYCYTGLDVLASYNKIIHKKGGKTVLWGCSVDPSVLYGKTLKDIASYDLITARESLTYEAIKKVNNNTILVTDPAFQLEYQDNIQLDREYVGINMSPLVEKSEQSKGIVFDNYLRLINYIIESTNMDVLLVPHVVVEGNDDRIVLNKLYKYCSNKKRVNILSDMDASMIKSYISKCKYFVGARTHATIAAYSTCVPTLVLGYSIKSKGIAKDIFGTYENYVIDACSLKSNDDLLNGFLWLVSNETNIRQHLCNFIPKYKEKCFVSVEKKIKK